MNSHPPRVILASTSPYRASLLRRIGVAFTTCAPDVDEAEIAGEPVATRALRLASAKAAVIARNEPDALVIGSDQVASLHGAILHKPGDARATRAQLRASSGHDALFCTAVCVHDSRSHREHTAIDHTRAYFRELTDAEIDRYIEREQPFDCAGGFKCEGLGIALFTRIETADPTALVGLPLIALARMLRDCGLDIP